jgi:hypothetical protein
MLFYGGAVLTTLKGSECHVKAWGKIETQEVEEKKRLPVLPKAVEVKTA